MPQELVNTLMFWNQSKELKVIAEYDDQIEMLQKVFPKCIKNLTKTNKVYTVKYILRGDIPHNSEK